MSTPLLLLLLACGGDDVTGLGGSATETGARVPNAAGFVAQSVPTEVAPGQRFTATVTMKNLGSAVWTLRDGYYLGSADPQDNFTWGTNRGAMQEGWYVPPGRDYTFTLDLTAPTEPGTYSMRWRMLQDAVQWFGPMSPNAVITVTGDGGGDPGPEPWKTAGEAQLRDWRGSIATTFAPVPCGPRPYDVTNPVFTAMYDNPCWAEGDRATARAALKARGYTHWPIGPIQQYGYHDLWPDTDWRSDPDTFLDRLEELWNDGFYPVVFLLPDTGLCADGSSIDHDCVERELTPIYQSARFQELAKIVVLAWEPDYSAADWQWGAAWMERVFPNALRYIHFPSGHGAPGRGSELVPDGPYENEAAMWNPVAPHIHGFLMQATWTFGGSTGDGRTPEEQFQYDLWDLVRRFRDGYAGWPTQGAGGHMVDTVAYEYASYFCFYDDSQGTPEEVAARAVEWGRIAESVDGVAGFGDGGP